MDIESLEVCIEKFIRLDREERKNMGIAGRQKMEKEFDKKMVVQDTLDTIEC